MGVNSTDIILTCDKCGAQDIYMVDGFVPDCWLEEYMDYIGWEYLKNDNIEEGGYYLICKKCAKKKTRTKRNYSAKFYKVKSNQPRFIDEGGMK